MYEEIKCPILGYTLTFPPETNHEIKFRKYANDFFYAKSKSLTALWKDAKTLDVLLEQCPSFLNQTIVDALSVIVNILKEYGVFTYSEQDIYEIFEERFDYTEELGGLYSIYEEICNEESNIKDYYDYKKTLPHSRLVGGGFGIKGAVKGILTAEAINMGVGMVRGFGNFVAKGMRNANVNLAKEKVYNNRETQRVLNASLSMICNAIIPICREIIEKHTDIKLPHFDVGAAHKLFMDSGYITDRAKLIEQLLDSLGKNPFNSDVYKSAVARLDDKDNRIQEMAKLFLCEDIIGDYKYNIADDILVRIANDEIDIAERKYSGNVFAKRLMASSDVSEFDERLEKLVDENQGITLLKFYDRVKDGENAKILEFIGDTFYNKANRTPDEQLKAANAYLRAANCGSPSSALKIANMLRDNLVILQDDDNAIIRYYTIAIEKDNAEAMCNLGVLYLEGKIIPANIEQGKALLQKAVDMRNIEAMYLMGTLMLKNIGFNNQQEEGKKLLNTAYNRGCVKSAEFFANGYEQGTNGLRKDLSLSRQWYKRAAEIGSTDSMVKLGHLYRKGVDVERNLSEAHKWYTEAKNNGSKIAYYFLGATYQDMGKFQSAITSYKEYYRIGADAGYAANALGGIYYNQLKEYREAFNWFEKGAALQNPNCQMSLGLMYARGHGIPTDYNKCAMYLKEARDNPDTTEFIKNSCSEKLAMLNYDGRRWTKKMFAKI